MRYRRNSIFGDYELDTTAPVEPTYYYRGPVQQVPHRCPVCEGRGVMPFNFYHTGGNGMAATITADTACKSCQGKGVIFA